MTQTFWVHRDNSLEALSGKFLYNMNAYSFNNVYNYVDDGIVIFGLITSMFFLTIRPFVAYLFYIWLFSFLWVSYSMDVAYRYLAYSFPIFLMFEALAITNILRILSKLIPSKFPNRIQIFITLLIPAVFIFFYARINHSFEDIFRVVKIERYVDQKMIGQFLKDHQIKIFMGRTEGLSFYSGGKMVYIPAATPETIVRFAKAWGVEYIVSRPVESSWDYMREIVNPHYNNPNLELIKRFEDGTLIWKVFLTEREKRENYREGRQI